MTHTAIQSLAKRGQELAQNPARIDLDLFLEAAENQFHATNNPDGAFPLNVAENNVMSPSIMAIFEQVLASEKMPEWVLKYTSMLGHPEVRESVAAFMRTYFKSEAIQADNLAFSAGASASLEVSSFLLGNPGDLVVIPAPAYPMYTKDFGIKSGMERYDLQTHYNIADHESLALVTIPHLEEALLAIETQGKIFKILLLTIPDNPTGSIYSLAQLREIAQWCMQNKIHLLVNEIYALSQIDIEAAAIADDYSDTFEFQSFATVMAEFESEYLHLLYALSKDFAISGMRFGIIHSLNPAFMQGLGNVNIPHLVSNMTQWLVGEMFKDDAFIAHYIKENKRRITESYVLVVQLLKAFQIPYTPSRGSLFVWADFSQYLTTNSPQAEEELWMNIFRQTGVLLTPGIGFQHQKHGLFRIVHTAIPTSDLKVAMQRLSAFLEQQ